MLASPTGRADALDLHAFLKWAVYKQMTREVQHFVPQSSLSKLKSSNHCQPSQGWVPRARQQACGFLLLLAGSMPLACGHSCNCLQLAVPVQSVAATLSVLPVRRCFLHLLYLPHMKLGHDRVPSSPSCTKPSGSEAGLSDDFLSQHCSGLHRSYCP